MHDMIDITPYVFVIGAVMSVMCLWFGKKRSARIVGVMLGVPVVLYMFLLIVAYLRG